MLMATRSTSYLSVLTLIRAKDEDSGNYTLQVENGDRTQSVGLFLEVKGQSMDYAEGFHPRCVKSSLVLTLLRLACITVPAVILDLMDIHHGSATGQSVVCITRGQPTPAVEWFVCKNIKL